jgi:thioredoxin 1
MSDGVVGVTDENFAELVRGSDRLVLLDFWASWCGPCKQIAPLIDELAEEYRAELLVGKVDTEANPELTARFSIRSIPALFLLRGGEIVSIVEGRTKTRIAEAIDSHL